MKAARYTIHLISVLLLVLWGAVMLYFYTSGRIIQYLPPDGIFRPLVLWSGLGMMVLGLFNLFTIGSKEADCGHDHGDGDCCGHDHSHEHHHHKHEDGEVCCSHHHDHDHNHNHEKGDAHAHGEKHDHSCCGHEHAHDHGHEHDHAEHSHIHGILNESGLAGKVFAIFMLAVPVTYAAIKTPDRFSEFAVMNKGVYDQNYGSTARADEFSLKRPAAARQQTTQQSQLPAGDAAAPGMTPAVSASKDPQGGIMVPTPAADKIPGAEGQDVRSYGSFTLQDLEQQIPKSPDGNFMLEVPEIYYTASDKEVQSVLTGQPVETIAQILPEKGELNADGKRARIFRMMVQCCAADARPYSIPVQFDQTPPTFKNMAWVKITGIVDYEQQEGQTIPVIRAKSLSEAAQPDDQKVY